MNAAEQVALTALRSRRRGAALAYVGGVGAGKSHAARALAGQGAVDRRTVQATASLADWAASLPRPRRLAGWVEGALTRLPEGDEALAGLAALLAALAPVVVLVEDLHLAPPEQLARWSRLAGRVGRAAGVVLLGTTREDVPAGFARVEVPPLDEAGVQALIRAELGEGVPEEVTPWVQHRTLGNPLFTLEYLQFLVRSAHLHSDGQRWHWRPPEDARVPGRVEALIALGLDRAAEARPALDARALVPDADREVWAQVAGLDAEELERSCRVLRQRGLLTGDALAHPLYGEVLRSQLAPGRRRELARRALEAYLGIDPLRASDFLDDAGLEPGAAADLLGRASAQAQRSGRIQQAGHLLARQSGLSSGAQRAGVALQAARLLQASDLPLALDLARTALREPGLTAQAAPVAAAVSARIGGQAALENVLLELSAVPADPPVDLLHTRVQALMTVGDHAGVVALQSEIRAAPPHEDVALGYALGMSLLALGRADDAEGMLRELQLAGLPPEGRVRLGGLGVMLQFHRGQYREAARGALELSLVLEEQGNLLAASAFDHNRAVFLRMVGDFADAARSVNQAIATRRALGDLRGYASSLGLRGELELEQGHLDTAEDALVEALSLLGYLEGSSFMVNTRLTLSRVYLHSDAPTAAPLALHHAERALELARSLRNPSLIAEALADLSLALTRGGQAERALAPADEARALEAQVSASPRHQVLHLVARGRALEALGDRRAARAALRDAEALARTHLGAYEADRLGVDLLALDADRTGLERLQAAFLDRGQGLGALLARRALERLASPETAGGPGPDLPEAPALRLQILGPLSANGAPVRGRVRRLLLLRLLEARLGGRPGLRRLELGDELYPGQAEPQALDALKQAVAGLRAAYGRNTVLTTAEGYALGAVQSDAEAFLAHPDARLWAGPCPPELDPGVQDTLHRVLLGYAQARLTTDPAGAARAGRLILDGDPLHEDALRLTLLALRRAGNHRSLGRLYAQARSHFAEVGTPLPGDWAEYLGGSGGA